MTPLNKKTAIALHQANQLAQAQAIYQKLLQQTPADADLWHRLGVLYLQQNQLTQAQDSLQQALSYQQKSPVLWLHCGIVLGSLNQHQLAQQSFERGLACALTTAINKSIYIITMPLL
ncbi:MAG: tetratricopeptide repeat protein [Moraxellaceae bacterium]|nr:tetratricopeptide repeat protein [Moraxellaceae bacterium]